jgi:hypothetical protein
MKPLGQATVEFQILDASIDFLIDSFLPQILWVFMLEVKWLPNFQQLCIVNF